MCRWWALPEVGVVPTLPLLAGFQQLVELDESKRILHELAQQRPVIDANSFSELKVSLLNAGGWVMVGILCMTGRLYVHTLVCICIRLPGSTCCTLFLCLICMCGLSGDAAPGLMCWEPLRLE